MKFYFPSVTMDLNNVKRPRQSAKKSASNSNQALLEEMNRLHTVMMNTIMKESQDNLQRYQSLSLKISMLQETITKLYDHCKCSSKVQTGAIGTMANILRASVIKSSASATVSSEQGCSSTVQDVNLSVPSTAANESTPQSEEIPQNENLNEDDQMLKVDVENISNEDKQISPVNKVSENVDVEGSLRFLADQITDLYDNAGKFPNIDVETSGVRNEIIQNWNNLDCVSHPVVVKTFSLPVVRFRSVLGKNASNVQVIENRFQVQINIGWPKRPEHLIFISGKPQNIEEAKDFIMKSNFTQLQEEEKIAFQKTIEPRSHYDESWFALPTPVCDWAIKDEDSNRLKQITLIHGALIKIGFPSCAFDRSLIIQGTPQQIDLAKELISAQLEVCLSPYPSYEKGSFNTNTQENRNYNIIDPFIQKVPNKQTYEIEFPLKSDSANYLIGKDGYGQKIRTFQQLFSVDIMVGWCMHSNNRIMVIRGDPHQIEHAKQAIFYHEVKRIARKLSKFKKSARMNLNNGQIMLGNNEMRKRKLESSEDDSSESDIIFEKRVRPEDKKPLAIITLSSAEEENETEERLNSDNNFSHSETELESEGDS